MTAFVSGLGQEVPAAVFAALTRAALYLRREVAQAVRLKYAPELHFRPDTAPDHAMRISAVLRRPEVARDLAPRPEEKEEG